MQVDILPALSVAASLDLQAAADAWAKARKAALRENHGRDDTRTYVLTLENFRQAHPFDYAAVGVAARSLPARKVTNGADPAKPG